MTIPMNRKAPKGVVLWAGPSQFDGMPIACVLTFNTQNMHTGPEIQSWILRTDIDPIEAVQTGADESICGTCPLRGIAKGDRWERRGCHILPLHGPLPVYKELVAGKYPKATAPLLRRYLTQQMLRLGTYGDPAMVPLPQWEWALGYTRGHTGYTNEWQTPAAQPYRFTLMASVRSEAEANLAVSMGWRYFRVRRPQDRVMPNEVICPKSKEAGMRMTCFGCGACDGWKREGQASVVIIAHGSKPSYSAAIRVLDSIAAENN